VDRIQGTRVTRLLRLLRLATLHETRAAIVSGIRSRALRRYARRALSDRPALVRELRNPATARAFVRAAVGHPATRELADAGMLLLPGRYLPVGWAATWVANRILRRALRERSGESGTT
jgi:hypothetical protein